MKLPEVPSFAEKIQQENLDLRRQSIEILQINVGKFCNMACLHCHVEAGPKRTEMMTEETTARILELIVATPSIATIDITGGAPELNPNFRYLVSECRAMGKQVIDRCNLTVLFVEGQEDTAEFLQQNQVQIVASLPCYEKGNVDKQRGKGTFDKSIQALHLLNDLGYGKPDTGLILNLVYNPVGAHLPPPQQKLQEDYKIRLKEDIGVVFNQLYTITNIPIKRYVQFLQNQGKLEEYMTLLVNSFNIQAALGVMCRYLVSVSWDGYIYDCDFNQMLEMPVGNKTTSIWDIDHFSQFIGKQIAFENHCYACTAGAGSSCSGSLV